MLPQFRFLAKLLLSSVQVVLAEKCHPLKDLPANPNNPKGLAILSDAFWDGCAFSASTGEDCENKQGRDWDISQEIDLGRIPGRLVNPDKRPKGR
jgi:hypothetical protein